jgi:hypothetical protein
MTSKCAWLVFISVFSLGCDSSNVSRNTAKTPAAPMEDLTLPEVAHPEFVSWNRFPAKSTLTRKKIVSNANGEVVVTTRLWLESKSPEGVTVGSQIIVKRPEMPVVDNGEDFVKYPAKYRLPKGFTESQFYLPSAKAKETGKELVQIGSDAFEATIYEWKETSEAGPTSVKLWRSDEVPGKLLRQEMYTKSSETNSIEEVLGLRLGPEGS